MESPSRVTVVAVSTGIITGIFSGVLGSYIQASSLTKNLERTISHEREAQLNTWKKEEYAKLNIFFVYLIQEISRVFAEGAPQKLASINIIDHYPSGLSFIGSPEVVLAANKMMSYFNLELVKFISEPTLREPRNVDDQEKQFLWSIDFLSDFSEKYAEICFLMGVEMGYAEEDMASVMKNSIALQEEAMNSLREKIKAAAQQARNERK